MAVDRTLRYHLGKFPPTVFCILPRIVSASIVDTIRVKRTAVLGRHAASAL